MFLEAYAYISANIRVLEKKLLDINDIERMMDAKDFNDAFKIFNDTDYADNLLNVEPKNYYTAVADDLRQLYNYLNRNVPDKKLIKFLLLGEDINNLKLLLKSKFGDVPINNRDLSEIGNVRPIEIQKYLSGEKNFLPDFLKEIIDRINIKLNAASEPHLIDSATDSEYYAALKDFSKKLKNKFIKDLIASEVDIINIKIFIRIKKLDRDKKFLESNLIGGGTVPAEKFIYFFNRDIKEFINFISRIMDKDDLARFIKYAGANDTGMIDVILKNIQLKKLKKTKYVTYGPEIIVNYFYQKITAVKNIRLIMIGKINKLDDRLIRERIII